jgi:hypothetical protein
MTVDRSCFRFLKTDESVDRLLVMLRASVSSAPLSSLKISGKLSRIGNRRSEL